MDGINFDDVLVLTVIIGFLFMIFSVTMYILERGLEEERFDD